MSMENPVVNSNFQEIKHSSRADKRGRLTLGIIRPDRKYTRKGDLAMEKSVCS
jgi:hypothetical protein